MRKLAFILLFIIIFASVLIFLLSIGVDLFGGTMYKEMQVTRQVVKDADHFLSENKDESVISPWNGIEYERKEALRQVKEMKNQVLQYVLFLQVTPIVLTLGSGYLIFLLLAWPSRCGKCKKLLAMKKHETKLVGSSDIHIKTELQNRSAYDGRVISTSEQYIPGTRYDYETIFVCKNCKATKTVHHSSKSAKT